MSMEHHIADGEAQFFVYNVTPDFCVVDEVTIPFDISQILPPEKADYAKTVFARSEKVILLDSIVKQVMGNAGGGVNSEVSLGSGHTKVMEGSGTVFIESRRVARDNDMVEMNGQV
jgi:hypothetical protein